jgi:diguanylate cyclase
MQVDRLKIDRAFVSALDQPGRGSEIASLVCSLGRRLGVELIAEGIEQPQQLERLRQLGCQLGQGYLFARPLPAPDWHLWLNANAGRASR